MIEINTHAIRFGEEPAGWIIVFGHENVEGFQRTSNKIFRTKEKALEFAKQINPNWIPIVKALRWAD
jgi:hypothetical protein